MKSLSHADLYALLDGACILGSGGGGPRSIGEQFLKYLLNRPPVQVADPREDVKALEWMAIAAGVGSPKAAASDFPVDVPQVAFQQLDQWLQEEKQQSLSYILPGEVGAGNSFIPLAVASQTNLPVVDASGARRAIPSLTQCTYADLPIAPVVLANHETQLSFSVKTAAEAEPAMRGIISSGNFTEDAGIAFWHMTGKTMQKHAVPNTLSYALELGKTLHAALEEKKDPVKAVCKYLDGVLLFVGKIVDTSTSTEGGFDFGSVTLENKKMGLRMIIYNQNENLIAWRSDSTKPQAIAPDLICYLTTDGKTFSNADLDIARGKEVAVIGAPCTPYLRAPKILAAFGNSLRGIGYGGAYQPIEEMKHGKKITAKKVQKIKGAGSRGKKGKA